MAEVLIVVAIIVVLAGVGFIALMSHMRNMQQLEMDGQAKEIFVAAQNHLAMADSQGYLGRTQFGSDDTLETGKDIYYYLVNAASLGSIESVNNPNNTDSVLNLMLPFASVDESARLSGSYIIRYQASSAQILDVFYVSTSGRYGLENGFADDTYNELMGTGDGSGYRGDDHKNDRKNYGDTKAVLGYYGGVNAALGRGNELKAPGVEIINAERLTVIVTDTNDAKNTDGSDNQVVLIVTGENGGEFSVPAVVGGEFTYVLDDVTGTGNHHFADLVSRDVSKPFVPGENITVKAIAYNNSLLTNVAESATQTTNSLYASLSGDTAEIANIRHLLNLDYSVSLLGIGTTLNKAVQTSDLEWTDFVTKTGGNAIHLKAGGSSPVGYYPVTPYRYDGDTVRYRLTSYDGQGHSIKGITVSGAASAGLFAALDSCTVSNLELLDFNISTSSGSAGALAGVVNDTTVKGVFVRNTEVGGGDKGLQIASTGDAAGGLAGSVSGTSTIDMCAAAVYVKASGDAGGLIGEVTGGTLTLSNSYSGGHTENAKYSAVADGTDQIRVNVIAGDAAGGLVGDASAGTVTISYSYSTASTQGGSVSGGLVGAASNDVSISYSYAVGKAFGAQRYTFLGTTFADSKITGLNYYLDGVTEEPAAASITHLSGIVTGDTSEAAKKFLVEDQKQANTYDPSLTLTYSGKYMFPTIEQLHTVVDDGNFAIPSTINTALVNRFLKAHYGDWQVPSLTPLNYTFINGATLYTEIELENNTSIVSLALQGETSGNVRVYIISVDKTNGTAVVTNEYYAGTGVTQTELTTRAPLKATYIAGSEDIPAKLHIDLDDITSGNGHFTQLFADGSANKLLPGENVTLYVAGGQSTWEELKQIEREEEAKAEDSTIGENNPYAKVQNSLFARRSDYYTTLATMYSADITLIRHLQNLDISVSNISKQVTSATLTDSITWNPKWNSTTTDTVIYSFNGVDTQTGKFNGIYSPYLTTFDGQGNSIMGLQIGAAFGNSGAGNSGLFRLVSAYGDLTIKNLYLKDLTNSSTGEVVRRFEAVAGTIGEGDDTINGAAGAVVAQITSDGANKGHVKLDTVIVEGKAAFVSVGTGTGAAGGLVGTSAGDLDITNSATTARVSAVAGNAGGMVGSVTSGKTSLFASYVGGHIVEGKYDDSNWNVISNSGAAGGIIGVVAAGSTLAAEKTFTTASVSGRTAGGIFGMFNGSVAAVAATDVSSANNTTEVSNKTLDYVYTIAPVANNTDGNASVGGIVGTTTGLSYTGSLFYLPRVYEDFDIDIDANHGGIKAIGTGAITNANVPAPGYVAASYFQGGSAGDGYSLSAISSHSTASMQQVTDAYDSDLAEAEFPFVIWTKIGGVLHFYGDWQPLEEEASVGIDISFLVQDPEENTYKTLGTYFPGYLIPDTTTVYTQLVPFEGAEVILPSLPDIHKYQIGTNEIAAEDLYKTAMLPATSTKAYVWAVYIGEPSAIGAKDPVGFYTSNGVSVDLPENLLLEAFKGVKTEDNQHAKLTMVAHYHSPAGVYYTVRLMDYDPKTLAEGASPAAGDYHSWGGVQVVNKASADNKLYFKNVYNYTGNSDFNAERGSLTIRRRNRSGYQFLGWYDGIGDTATQVFSYKDGVITLETPAREISSDVVLYAHYKADDTATIKLSFVLVQEGENGKETTTPLNAVYQLEYDKSRGFHQTIPLPGKDAGVQGVRVEKVMPGETEAVNADQTEFSFIKKTGSEDQDEAVELNTGTENIPEEYIVYFKGQLSTYAYVVVREFQDTLTGDGYAFDQDGGSKYIYVRNDTYTEGDSFGPKDEDYLTTIPDGFKSARLNSVPFTKDMAGTYGITTTTVSGYKDGKINGKDITHVLVLSYPRKQVWLKYDNMKDLLNIPANAVTYGDRLLKVGEPLPDVDDPDYDGFDFGGWNYKDGSGQLMTDGSGDPIESLAAMPNHDVTREAIWLGEPVNFSLVIWVQNAENDRYSVVEKKTLQAYAGDKVSVSADDNGNIRVTPSDPITGVNYGPFALTDFDMLTAEKNHHLYNHIHVSTDAQHGPSKNVKVAGNGNSVVNIYFDRNVYTLRFDFGFAQKKGDNGTTMFYAPITAADAYTHNGPVYAVIDNQRVQMQPYQGKDSKFFATVDPNGTPYGVVDGKYVPLEAHSTFTYRPEFIYTATEYDVTDEHPETQYGIVDGNFVELKYYTTTDGPGTDIFELTNSALTAGKEYLIVSTNASGPGKALRNDNEIVKSRDVSIQPAANGRKVYVIADDVDGDSIWRTEASGSKWRFKNGSVYVKRKGNDRVELKNDSGDETKWTWEGNNNFLYVSAGNDKFYLRYNYGFSVKKNSGRNIYLYEKTKLGSTVYHYYYGDDPDDPNCAYEGIRYTRTNYPNNGPTTYTESQVTTINGKKYYYDNDNGVYIPVVVKSTTTNNYTYEDNPYDGPEPVFLKLFDGKLFKENPVPGTWTFYVSPITNTDNYDEFLTNTNASVGNVMPVSFIPCVPYKQNNNTYVFHYDISAKFDQTIIDQYPGTQPTQGDWRFVGWIAEEDSYIWATTKTSVKGHFATMSEELILYKDGLYTPRTNTGNHGIIDVDKATCTARRAPQIAQEFRCRYVDSSNNYLYKIYLADPNTRQYSEDPTKQYIVHAGTSSYPNMQTEPTFPGYTLASSGVLTSYNAAPSTPGSSYSGYDIPELEVAGVSRGMIMEYRFQPNYHSFEMWYLYDTPDGTMRERVFNKDVIYYDQSLASYGNTTFTPPAGYSFDGNWYDNEECSGTPLLKQNNSSYNQYVTMPDSNVTLYTKLTHDPVSVTFKLDTSAGEHLEGVSLNENGEIVISNWVYNTALEDNETVMAYAPTKDEDEEYSYTFDGWKNDSTNLIWSESKGVTTNLTLVPNWSRTSKTSYATITVHYMDVSSGTAVEIPEDKLPIGSLPDPNATPLQVGETFTMRAPEIQDYTPVTPIISAVVTSEDFHVDVNYRQSDWRFTVKYYVVYESIAPESSWLKTTFASDKHVVELKDLEHQEPADAHYHLFGYTMPAGAGDWLSKYHVDHFVLNGDTDHPVYDSYVTISPNDQNTATLAVYLKPDTEDIEIPDIVRLYSGQPMSTYSMEPPLTAPADIGEVKVKFVYYDSSNNVIADTAVKNAGAYGVRAYITMTAKNGSEYLLWQSEGTASSPAPLHLYIQRRIVILHSAFKTQAYSAGSYLAPVAPDDVYFAPNNGAGANEAEVAIYGLYNALDLHDFKGTGADGVLTDEEIGNAGFVTGEGIIPEFAASAYRRNVGETPNLFTFKAKSGTDLNNYYFYVLFGTLEITAD